MSQASTAVTAPGLQQIIADIQAKRAQLESGALTVDQYLKAVQPQTIEGLKQATALGGTGSGGANRARAFIDQLQQVSGLQQDLSQPGVYKVNPSGDFSTKYQQQIRESLLPASLTPEQRAAYLNDIPEDIQYGSDQYNIEKEGIRQKLQAENTAATQKTQRASQLSDLASLLSTQADTNFARSIPKIAEDANTGGIFRSTGYGNALAEQQKQLQEDVASKVSQQGLQDRAADTQSLSDILTAAQGFQTSGLERTFSLEDFNNQTQAALKFAQASQPQAQGKTGTEKAIAGTQLAVNTVNAGANAKKAK